MRKPELTGYIFILEVIVVALLVIHAYYSFQTHISVSPISRTSVASASSSQFANFYELQANSDQATGQKEVRDLRYRINADSLHAQQDYTVVKPANTFRIISLGDSITFGLYVGANENYSERLAELLNYTCRGATKYEVINLGVPGYDIAYSAERYRLRGQKYKPDLVIWQVNDSDFVTRAEIDRDHQSRPFKDHQESHDDSEETPHIYSMADNIQFQTQTLHAASQYFNQPLVMFDIRASNLEQYAKSFADGRSQTYYYELSQDSLNDSGGIIQGDGHPNTRGHEIIAREMADYLIAQKLIPCAP